MDQNPKQQVVERIKSSTNILVTVSNNPSVDQLAACIGFTLMLNKLGKHATAVFSGAVPSTLEFLQPEKTLEKTTDSLQDFIIALDKAKADKLRYKVEDEVVRIFITPYRASISEKDLQFSLGDFNVDAVVALGVTKKEEIDQAIVAHGRILHDAIVMTVTDGEVISDVGSINWHEPAASSLSEMLVSISESFQSGLLDPQMATSFLTGIVAETERFSNSKTSPKVMTMSAQLMAAGANQQLIATKLAPPAPEPAPLAETPAPDSAAPDAPAPEAPAEVAPAPKPDGEIDIPHEHEGIGVGVGTGEDEAKEEGEIHIDDDGNLKLQHELEEAQKSEAEAAAKNSDEPTAPPSFLAGDAHKVIDPLPGQDQYDPLLPTSALPAALSDEASAQEPALDLPAPQTDDVAAPAPAPESPAPAPETPAEPTPEVPVQAPEPLVDDTLRANPLTPDPNATLTEIEKEVDSPHAAMVDTLGDARKAVEMAGLDIPPRPAATQSLGAQHVDLAPPTTPAPADPVFPPTPTMTGVADILQATSSGAPAEAPASAAPTDQANPLAPPPVPPPMTAPYFEPKTSHHNPYLNPNGKPTDDPAAEAPL